MGHERQTFYYRNTVSVFLHVIYVFVLVEWRMLIVMCVNACVWPYMQTKAKRVKAFGEYLDLKFSSINTKIPWICVELLCIYLNGAEAEVPSIHKNGISDPVLSFLILDITKSR